MQLLQKKANELVGDIGNYGFHSQQIDIKKGQVQKSVVVRRSRRLLMLNDRTEWYVKVYR